MRYCSRCLQTDTRPNVLLDERGICPACNYFEQLERVDWEERTRELKDLARELRSPDPGDYDCIIGVSGGKDSLRQALYTREVLGLRPLLVCLGYPPRQVTQRGVDNLSNLIERDFDCLLIQPAPETWRQLMRAAFLKFANWCKATEYPLFASVPRIATAYQIRLVLWGENPALQLGDLKTMGKTGWDGNAVRDMNTLQGGSPGWMLDTGTKRGEILQYFYPERRDMERAGIQIVYLGYFWKDWSLLDNADYAVVQGLDIRQGRPEDLGDPYGVTSLDEDWVGMNQMIKYLKFGFGRTSDYVNENIRWGRMTREEGIRLVENYDGRCSDDYIESFCRFVDIPLDQFWQIVDRHVNEELFEKTGTRSWKRRFKVGFPCA
ncbi:MAG: N-acetyl sugar amidotransferase [Planctomycetes bacterium]|nr:N-acetyl sugar amidotransferase [Planctomycetota bacterium]